AGGLAEAEGRTLFAVLLAAFQALLMRASGQPEVVVGTPVAARLRAELEPLVGFFANVLALPGELEPGDDFRRLLRRTWAMVREALARQEVPFDRVVEAVAPERLAGADPLFGAMFAMQNMAVAPPALPRPEVAGL